MIAIKHKIRKIILFSYFNYFDYFDYKKKKIISFDFIIFFN